MNAIIAQPGLTIRAATMADVAFIDGLQKQHVKMVGWMPTKQLEAKVNAGQVLIAEGEDRGSKIEDGGNPSSILHPPSSRKPVGYCMGQDQYFKRDDVGIIYQLNIASGMQRGLIGAALLKAQFEKSAWGCKLYCCWCAQDIAANKFWEAMGFVPLAFRAGSRGKQRIHIFWQRRIRAGDTTTPYWYPAQTTSGSIREDRLVLPIPHGVHWSEAKPLVLPGMEKRIDEAQKKLPGKTRKVKPASPAPSGFAPTAIGAGRAWFAPASAPVKEKKAPEPKKKLKNDPRLVAAARELRDRWLEQVNAEPLLESGKYDVSRELPPAPPQGDERIKQITSIAA